MSEKARAAENLELVGGRLCLDFANTLSTRLEGLGREYLNGYPELVAWGRHAGVLAGDEAAALLRCAARQPGLAASALARAIDLREAIYRIFAGTAHGRRPRPADLAALNAMLRQALARLEVRPIGERFAWTWAAGDDDLDRALWPVARSSAELLTSDDLARVGQCQREGCDWLFVDASKNRSRRWCIMNVCGARVKMRRYYQRKKH